MATRARWRSAGWQAWLLALLWLGHGLWVMSGRWPGLGLVKALNFISGPVLKISAKWEARRVARSQTTNNLSIAEKEIAQLKARIGLFELQEAREGPRRSEAEEAIRLLGLKQQLPLETKAARVIANTRTAPFGGLVIDQGSELGLQPDQGVIAPEGVVGRIWSAGPRQASVLPLDAYNASTGVMLARSRATGVLQGTGPGKAEIRYISSQEGVQVGEAVYTSGLDRIFPRGLLIGFVSQVRPRDAELKVEVSLSAPLDRLYLVLVLPSKPPIEVSSPAAPPAGSGKGLP
ncbi:MAG: rod shape-determining protein MreC [Holophagaceae bacterium]|nr:rod shape-determining protein MreC [Holophagaceae bacterium]